MNKILLATVLMLGTTICSAESPYWVKTHEPMKVVAWVKKPAWFIDNLCGKSDNRDETVFACIVRPGDKGKEEYSRPDGAVIYSTLGKHQAELVKSCDGLSMAAHEVHHAEMGEDHYGKCPA